MVYVMSDIHGNYEKYIQVFDKKIEFIDRLNYLEDE